MSAFLLHEDRGAAAIDWILLTAGIAVLGVVVAYSVMGNSRNRLQETFDQLNQKTSGDLAVIERSIDFAGPGEQAGGSQSYAYESDPLPPATHP